MDLDIKKITEEELDKFYDFFQKSVPALFPEYNKNDLEYIMTKGWTEDRYLKDLRANRKVLLTALSNGKIVGVMDFEAPHIGVSFGVWLMVDERYQGKGIGTRLLEEFEKISKDMGAHSAYLYSGDKKVEFYKHRGYELVGVHKKAWFGQDHFYFTKQIANPREENYLK